MSPAWPGTRTYHYRLTPGTGIAPSVAFSPAEQIYNIIANTHTHTQFSSNACPGERVDAVATFLFLYGETFEYIGSRDGPWYINR